MVKIRHESRVMVWRLSYHDPRDKKYLQTVVEATVIDRWYNAPHIIRARLDLFWACVNEALLESDVNTLATRGEIEAVYRRTTCARQAARFIVEERKNRETLT